MNKAVIVFLKVPRHGQVKTRLTRILDRGLVLELYRAFVLDTLDAVKNCGKVFVFFWPQDQEGDLRKWLVSHNRFICQAG